MTVSIPALIEQNQDQVLRQWSEDQKRQVRSDLIGAAELNQQMNDFLKVFVEGLSQGQNQDVNEPAWKPARDFLQAISHSRSIQGFSPSETATFVFALKRSLLALLAEKDGFGLKDFNLISDLLDRLGLYTTEVHQQAREQVIIRQQQDMLELSTPVVELAPGIIALPMIGTLDSARTEIVMGTLLQKIVDTSASVAIIDITGVPTVDTLVAQHLIKTITAARLMGAECIVSGIRPQIASTIVHLGVELNDVATKASLASALALAYAKTGYSVVKTGSKAR